MKRSFKSTLGVTLLEIMLVLAIAAMVVVMSIRYYQTASLNQKVSSTMNNIVGIVAAGESYYSATNTMAGLTSANLVPYLPGGTMPFSAWGGSAIKVGNPTTSSYDITVPNVPGLGCTQLQNMIKTNPKLTSSTTCGTTTAGADLVITVTM